MLGRDFHRDEEGAIGTANRGALLQRVAESVRRPPDVPGRTVTLQSLVPTASHVVIGVPSSDFQFAMAAREFCRNSRSRLLGCAELPKFTTIARLADEAAPETAAANMTSVLEHLRKRVSR